MRGKILRGGKRERQKRMGKEEGKKEIRKSYRYFL